MYFCAKALLMLSEWIKVGFTPRIFWSLAFTLYLTQFTGYTYPQCGTERCNLRATVHFLTCTWSMPKCAFCPSYHISWEVCIKSHSTVIICGYIIEMCQICDFQRIKKKKKANKLYWPITQNGRTLFYVYKPAHVSFVILLISSSVLKIYTSIKQYKGFSKEDLNVEYRCSFPGLC